MWIAASSWGWSCTCTRDLRKATASEHHHDRHWTGGIRRSHQDHLNVDADLRVRRIIHVTRELLPDDRTRTNRRVYRVRYCPSDFGHVLGNTPEHLALEVLDNFGAALIPPHCGCRDSLAGLQGQDVGQIRKGIGL